MSGQSPDPPAFTSQGPYGWWSQVRPIPGWLSLTEAALLRLAGEVTAAVAADLLEIGAFHGQGAATLAFELAGDQQVWVVDPFGIPGGSRAVRDEQELWYRDLSRADFESSFGRVHERPAKVIEALSTDLAPEDLDGKPYRVIHVDGAHDYDSVCHDIDLSLAVLADGGIVVFDDIANTHSPGVAAAVWAAVDRGQLAPLMLTNKLQSCRPGDHQALRSRLLEALSSRGWNAGIERPLRIAGFDVIRDPRPPAEIDAVDHPVPDRRAGLRAWRGWVPPVALSTARRVRDRARTRGARNPNQAGG